MKSIPLVELRSEVRIARLPPEAAVPTWFGRGDLSAMIRTAQELTLIAPAEDLPPHVQSVGPYRTLGIEGFVEFSIVGVIASLASPLAAAGLSIFVLSTFDTDYLLLRTEIFDKAVATLRAAGHTTR